MKRNIPVSVSRTVAAILILIFNLSAGSSWGQTPVPMASQPSLTYTETFNAISTWSNNFGGSVTAETRWKGFTATSSGTIPAATAVTATTVFSTGSGGGVQKGTNNMVFLSTGNTSNTSSTAADFFMDFTGVNAGTLSVDLAEVNNSSGDRGGSLKIFWSTDGTTWTELTTTNLPFAAINNVASSASITGLALPSAFNNSATARLRFYYYNGPTTGTGGSRPKISIDNLVVTAVSSGCSTAPTSLSASPSATILCSGATLTLTGAATGATSYSWSGPNSLSSTAQVTSLTVNTLSAGSYTLSATNACGTSTVSSVAITVNTAPTTLSATPSATSLCSGATLTLTGAATGATSYLWSGPNSYSSTLLNPASFSAGPASGSYTLAATNSCGTASVATTSVTIQTAPTAVTATPSATSVCSGSTLTLTGAATGATSYAWSGPNAFSSTLLTPAAFTVGTASAGSYTLAATNSCGTTTVATTAITISTLPTTVTATPSATSICTGSTITLTGAATGATAYAWSGPNSFSSTLLNPASFSVSTLSAGIYTLTATNSCGSTVATTASVTVNGLPSAPSFSGTATIAYGASTTLSLSGGSNDVVYYWTGAGTANTTLSAGGTGSFTVSPSTTTTYSVTSVTSSLGCTLSSITGVTVTITVTGSPADTIPTMDDNMAMGNPSGATTSTSDVNNYLMVKPQYSLSYNNSKGEANWVSWHLSTAWKGSAVRCDCFYQDSTLPSGYYRAATGNYTGSGFDRGHMCPSDDRDLNDADNMATFKMTNIAPQAPNLNQITWESLESYCRALIYAGNELYIISGGYGSGGTGSAGSASTIASGNINVPSRYFKVVVVLPVGTNDVNRVTTSTRVIAVDMPNTQTVNSQPWGYYRTSVDAIEAATGYDFLSNVPTGIQAVIEAGVDNGPTNVLAWDLTGTGGDATFAATSVSSNLDATSDLNTLTRGSSAAASTGANSFRTTGFQNNGISTSNTDYFQVKMRPVSGKRLSLSTIDATCTGTASFAVSPGVTSQFAYSFDGTTFTLIGSPMVTVGTPANLPTVNVSGISALQNISSTSTLYIRYYASGQSPTGGWGFYSQYSGNYGLSFDGSFTDEPCTTAPTAVSANLSSATVCNGGTITLSGAATSVGATTYSWTGPNSYSSTALSPASFTVGTASAGVYTLVATNACGSTTVTTAALTVDAGPTSVSATPSSTSLCSGNTLTLTGTATGATSYSWSGPNSFSSTDLNPASFTVGTASAGVYTLAATNSCGTTTVTTASVAVTTIPTVAAISGSTTVTVGGNITLTNATAGGTWTSGTTSVATITSGGMVTGVSIGSSIISYSVSNLCGSTTTTLAVNVTAAPDVTTFSFTAGTATATSSTSAQVPVAGCTAAIGNSFGTVSTPITSVSGSNTYTGATGTYNIGNAVNVTGNTTFNSSTSPYISFTLTPNAGYAINLTGISFGSRGTATGPGAYTISTSVAGFGSSISSGPLTANSSWALYTPTIASVTGAAGTAITVRIYGYGGTGSPGSGTINWKLDDIKFTYTASATCSGAPTAVTATPSATTLCSGNTLTLTGAATDASSYSWSGPNSFSSTALTPASFTVNTASAGVYTLVATNPCGSTTVTTTAITINTAPTAVSATPSATTICNGGTLTLTGAATGATSYSWTGPGSYTATDLNPAAFTVNTASAGIYTLTASNSCGNTIATTSAIIIGTAPTGVSATAASTVCVGGTITLSGTATGATSYAWSGPGGYSSTDMNPAGFSATTGSAGIYTLTATNSCGSTTATTIAVTVNDVPTAVSAGASPATLCTGTTLTLTGSATSATAYSWSGPGSFSSTDLNPAAFTVNTASAGVYTLTATNSCGNTIATTVAVTVNGLPAPTLSGTAIMAYGSNTTLTFTGNSGDVINYSWTGGGSSSTTIGVSGTSVVTVSPTATTTYSIDNATSAAGCFAGITGQSATITVDMGCTVAPTSVSATLSSAAICNGSTLTLTGAATNATSYSWSGPNSFSSTDLNPAAFTVGTAAAGVYTLTATNLCGSTTATTGTLVINVLPSSVSATPSATSLCSGNTLTLTGAATDATSYSWSGPNSYSSTDLTPASFTVGTASAGVYTLSATNSCGTTTATTTSVAVITVPTVAAISGSTSVSVGGNITLTNATAGGTWTSGTTSVATITSGGMVTGVSAGSSIISYTVTNTCGSTTTTLSVTVTPAADNTIFSFTAGTATATSSSSAQVPVAGCTAAIGNSFGTVATPISTASGSSGYTGATSTYNIGNAVNVTGNTTFNSSTSPYISFTLTPNAGYSINLTGVSFGSRATGSGPAAYTISTSVGGFGSAISSGTLSTAGSWSLVSPTITSVTGTAGTAITVRIYGYGGTGSPTSGTINWRLDDIKFTYTATASCSGAPTAVTATPSATTLCSGNTLTLTGASTGATSYSWSGPNSFSSTALSPASFTVNTASAGVYTLTATNACGSTTVTTAAVAVNPLPASTISGTTTVALGGTATLTFSGVNGDVVNYSWTGGGSSSTTIGVSGTSVVTVSPSSTTTYSITSATSAASCSATITGQSATVTVDMGCTVAPTGVSATLSSSTLCVGNTLTLTGAATNALSYSWSGPNGYSSTLLSPASFTVGTASAGVYTLTATNACGSTTATTGTLVINVLPSSVSATPSATSLCSGNTLTLTGSATDATSYSWSGPNSYSSTNLNPAAFTVGTASAGVYTLSATNSCGTTTATTTSVAVITVPTVAAISGSTSVAIGGNITLTNATAGGTWTSGTTSVATITSGGMVTGVSAGSSIISYTVTNTCGSTTTTLSVIVTTASDNTTFSFTAGNATATSSSSAQVPVAGCTAAIGNSFGTVATPISTTSGSSGYTGATSTYNIGNAVNVTGNTTFNSSTSPYVSFTLTPNAGYAINLTGVSFGSRATGSGPAAYTISTSVGGFGSAIGSGTLSTAGSWSLVSPTISSVTSASGTAITVRIYGYGGTGSPTSGTINWRLDDIKFTYTASPTCTGAPTAVSATPSAASLCSGSTLTLTGAATGAISYSWSGPNSFSSTALSPASFTVNTASAGVYTLVATNPCGSTTVTTTAITVNTAPTSVSATPSATTLCDGTTLTLTGAATDATSYSWSGPGSYSATDLNPAAFTVNTASAGIYTLTATNTCGNTVATTSAITIGTAPTAVTATASAATVCLGGTLTLSGAATGATTYSWSGPAGFSSTDLNPAGITASPSVAGIYSLTAINSCGSTTATTISVAVIDVPSAVSASTSATTICGGSTLTLTGSASDATSYSWSGPDSYASTDLNPAGFVVTPASAGIYTLTATNSCGNTTATTASVTVNNTPISVSASASATTLCSGSTLTLTGSATDATAYSWSGPDGYSSTDLNPAAFTVNTASAGVYTLTATNSCGIVSATIAITVSTSPVSVTATPSATSLCIGSTLTLTGAATGATSYSWSGPAGFSSTDLNPAAFTVGTANAGIYSLTATNSCGSTTANTASIAVLTIPTVAAISGSSSVTVGSTITLTNATAGGTWTSATTYAATVSATGTVYGVANGASIISYTVTNICGSATSTLSVSVVPPVVELIGWNTSGNTGTYGPSPFAPTTLNSNLTTLSGLNRGGGVATTGTPANKAWGGADWQNTSAATAVSNGDTVNYVVKPNTGYKLSFSSFVLNYRRASSGPSAGELQYSVNGSAYTTAATLSYSSSSSSGATLPTVTLSGISALQNIPSTSSVSFRIANYGGTGSAGTWYIFDVGASTASDMYFTGTVSVDCSIAPSSVTATPSATTVCNGSTLSLTGAATNAVSYSWTGPNGFSSTAQSPAAFTVGTASAGIYTLVASNACGTVTTVTTPSITVNTIPGTASAALSATTLCSGSTLSLTGSATGATSYSWSGPGGFTATGATPAAFTVNTASAGVYTLTATNSCGSASVTSTTLTVNPLPAPTIAGTTTIIIGSGTTLAFSGTAGDVVNYSWTGGGSASTTIDVSGSTIVSVTPTSTTTYSITSATSALGCAATITGQQATVTVDLGCTGAPTAVTASLSAGSVCSGGTLTLTGTATDALTYSWSGPAGFTSSDLNPAGITVTGASAGIYTLSATNSCGTTTVTTASLVISTVPSAVSATASASTLCAGTTLSLTGSASGATDYSWSGPAGYSSTNANPAPFSVTTASTGIYTLTATNSCGSTTATASVSVITTPTVAAIAPASASIAAGSQVTLTNATAGGTWTISDLAVAGISSTGVVTGFSAGSATVTYTVINACGTTFATSAIAVSTPTSGTIYLNNFGATTATASDAPAILDAHLTTPTPAWTSTTALTSFGGATGQALSMSNSSGTPSYTLTLNVASGYTLQVDSFNFWRNHSASGASHWVLSINGTNVGSGDLTGTTGAYVGMTGVSTPITNLTGTVTVKLQLSGATGTGTFRLDDFQLNGIVVGHPLPVLASGPANDTIVAGDNSSFTVTASGAASYQWQRNTSGLSGGIWTNITSASLDPAPGTYSSYSTTTTATSNTLNLSTVPATWDGYAYRCIVTNDGGSVTSSAALLTVVTPPVCSGTPTAGSATATTSTFCGSGSSAINTTGTTLASGLAYQWQSSSDSSAWSDITGATSTSYTTPVITGTTYYRMAVTCSATSLTGYTNGARITINPMPVISIPATVAICSGTSGTLVTASGAASYTWTPAAGLSATTGASVMVNTTTNRTYTITGTSAAGCVSTNTMSATYNNTPAPMAITPSYLNMCPSSAPQMLTIPGGALSPSAVYSGGSITINGGATAYSTSTLTASAVPAGAYITGVSVNFTASMPWQADYVINLVSPDGHILNLTNLKGIAAATTGNFSNTTVSSAGGATFPTGSAVPASTTFSADAAAGVGGSTYPSNAANFNELLGTINGDWKLVFYQATSFTNANGTLSNWSLTFNYSRSVTWSPATNLFTDAAGTIAYTGAATDTVYVVAPATTGVVNYVATSSNNGCTSAATDTINVQNGPTMSLGSIPTVCNTTPSISIPYSASSGAATYSLIWNAAALAAGFTNVTGAPLPAPYLSIATPGTTASYGDFSGVITVTDAICTGPATTVTVTLLHTPSASVTAYDAPCMGHPAGIVITGTPSSTIHYMVDSGSAVTADIDGTGTLNLPTGIITAPHNYTISSVSESICFSVIDTVLNVTPIPMQWLGGASGHETDWNTPANWSCGFVPTSADSVIITTTTYMPVLPTTVSATVNDLDIASGSTIQLDGSSAINVNGDIYNSGVVNGTGRVVMNGSSAQKLYGIGTISNLELNNSNGATIQPGARTMISSTLYLTAGTLATNDSLELLSTDTSATARIAEIPATGAAVSGRVKTDQYVQGGYRRFRFWGHSFSDTISLSQLTPYIDITGPGGSSNGFTTTTTNNPSAFRYDPYIGNDTSSYSSGWIPFTRINASAADSNRLHPGQGIRLFFRGSKGEGLGYLGYYGMYTPSATINKMIGHVNQGDVSIFLKRGTDVQTYNQISNPYPSPVDIGTVLFHAKQAGQITGGAFYVWNPAIGAGGQYMAIPIGTSAAEPYYIQANTSFQVKADHDGAHVDFVESNKVPGASLNLFRAPAQAVRFNIYDTAYHLWDVLSLQFNSNASDNEDKQLDATKPYGPDMNFYSISADGRKLAIDARPYEGDKVIPLGVKSAYQQDFVIRAESISIPAGGAVTLHDKLLNKYVEMKEGTEYRFTIGKDKSTQGDERFELNLKPTVTVAKGLEVSMAPNPASDDVKITFTSGSKDNVSVRIMDVSGVSIYSQDLGAKQNGVITVPMSNFAAGVYMVEITQGDQKITKRLVKE